MRAGARLTHFLLTAVCVALRSPVLAQGTDTIVKNVARPVHSGLATLSREVRIGSLDGADEYVLGDVSEIAVGRDGSIYVYDRQVPVLRKYDAAGKFVKQFGRKGQGPGEYLNAGGLAVLADGRVLLWDTGNWRVNVYASDGAIQPSWSTLSGSGGNVTMSTGRAMTVDTSGRIYIKRRLFTRGGDSPTVWVRYRPNGAPLDTMELPAFNFSPAQLQATSASGNARSTAPVPFWPVPQSAMSPLGYLVTGVPDRYAFEIHSEGTRSVMSVRRAVEPLTVSGHERDSARAALTERMARTQPGWSWNGPDIPKVRPFYAGLSVGEDGRIWLPIIPEVTPAIGSVSTLGGAMGRGGGGPPRRTESRSSGTPRPALFDVFEADGTYLGQVQIPPRVSTVVRRGDYVWGVEFDEDDVQRVVRYRIVWR
jgi:hypothetical protein